MLERKIVSIFFSQLIELLVNIRFIPHPCFEMRISFSEVFGCLLLESDLQILRKRVIFRLGLG